MPFSAICFPTSSANWTNPNNANADDGVFATNTTFRRAVSADPGAFEVEPTDTLVCGTFTGLDSGIAAGDTINGIAVSIKVKQAGVPGIVKGFLWLARGGVQIGNTKPISSITTTLTAYDFGGASDTLGGTWHGADLAGLQVMFYAQVQAPGLGTSTVSVDYVAVAVSYTAGTPNAFTFTDVTGATQNTVYASNTIAVSGLGGGTAAVSIVPGSGLGAYQKNGGPYTSNAGTAVDGDSFNVRVLTSALANTAVTTTLTIGGISDTYSVTTIGADTTPDAFSFPSQTGAQPSTQYQSSGSIIVSGINSAAAISISGGSGQYRIGATGSWTSGAGTVNNGDAVFVRATSSGSYSTGVTATLSIGGVTAGFTITTRAVDTTPNAFTFVDNAGVSTATLSTSNTITVSGIEAAASLTFTTSGGTGHEYSVNGGSFTALGPDTISNGDTLAVRMTSPAASNSAGNITVNIGGVNDTFTVSTGADTVPSAFSFTDVTARPGVLTVSNTITLAGMTAAVNVAATCVGGEMQVGAGSWVSSANVVNGDTVKVRATSSLAPGVAVNVTLSVGGVSDTFTITTSNAPLFQPDF